MRRVIATLVMGFTACTSAPERGLPGGSTADAGVTGSDDARTTLDATVDPDGGASVDATSSPDAGVIDAGPVTLGPCQAPANLPPDPIRRVEELSLKQDPRVRGVVHMLDIEQEPETGRFFLVGSGGLFAVEAGAGAARVLGVQPGLRMGGGGGGGGRGASYAKIEVLSRDVLAATNRDLGISFVDLRDATQLRVLGTVALENASGMALLGTGEHLLVLTHSGEAVIYDVSDPTNALRVGSTTGLGNPWEAVVVGSRAYVADNSSGLVVLDVSNVQSPSVVGSVQTAGGAQDIDVEGRYLHVAVGGAGIQTFDIRGHQDAPQPLSTLSWGTAVVSVSASGSTVWGTTHEAVVVMDTTDPARPVPLGSVATDQWAMHVLALGNQAFVADWEDFESYAIDTMTRAPRVDVERSELYFFDEPNPVTPTTATLDITNRGGAQLQIVGAAVPDARFSFSVDRAALSPGASAVFTVRFQDDGNPVNTSLCIATNDPSQPTIEVALRESSNTNTRTGETAPDFDLPSVDSDTDRYRLSDQLGRPVVLVYFATW